jgi:cold shock CspA family protein
MKAHGTLTKWNHDRGFGFIALPQSGTEVFVHISAFPRDGVLPRVGELVAFEIEEGRDGRQRAVRVSRPGANPRPRPTTPPTTPVRSANPRIATLFAVTSVAAIGAFAYTELGPHLGSDPTFEDLALDSGAHAGGSRFKCDGRTHCSEMTSCAEARYFLANCPDTRMDGNNDGEPCEQQWCN